MNSAEGSGRCTVVGVPWPGAEVAAEAEAAGFGAFCTGEFVDHEAYARVAEMLGATSTAQVGTASGSGSSTGSSCTVKTYDPFVAHHGWEEPVAALRPRSRRGDRDGMAAAVTDEMLTAIAVCDTSTDARIAAREGRRPARDVAYLAPTSFMVSRRRKAAYARSSLGMIGSVRS